MNSNDALDALQRQMDDIAAGLAKVTAELDAIEQGRRRPQQQHHTPAAEPGTRMEDIKIGMRPEQASKVAGAIVRALGEAQQ